MRCTQYCLLVYPTNRVSSNSKLGFSRNIGFTLERALTVFTRSTITSTESEPIWLKSGALWAHWLRLAVADFWRDPRSSESWRARQNLVLLLSDEQRTILPIFRRPNLNITRLSVRRWILSEQNFENFPVRGRFCKKKRKKNRFLTPCDFRSQ